jgi:hypothetical protein
LIDHNDGEEEHGTMNDSMQEHNRATNGNKGAYIILDINISAVFDKILDNRQVIVRGSQMHGRIAILRQQYQHHQTQQAVAAAAAEGQHRGKTGGLIIMTGGGNIVKWMTACKSTTEQQIGTRVLTLSLAFTSPPCSTRYLTTDRLSL